MDAVFDEKVGMLEFSVGALQDFALALAYFDAGSSKTRQARTKYHSQAGESMSLTDPKPELVAAIVRDAGGEIVGWFRLHRTAYLLEAAGLGSGFRFFCRGGGPHSSRLYDSAMVGTYLGKLKETECKTDWGGHILCLRGQ